MADKNDFVVDLGGLEIDDRTRAALASDIQRVVLSHLVDIDFRGDYGVRLPGGHTQGIIIRPDVEGKLFG